MATRASTLMGEVSFASLQTFQLLMQKSEQTAITDWVLLSLESFLQQLSDICVCVCVCVCVVNAHVVLYVEK